MRARRLLSVLALAAIASTGLTACRTNVGAAAYVGNTKITESKLHSYLVNEQPPTPAPVASGAGSAQAVNPAGEVLSFMLMDAVFGAIAQAHHVAIDAASLNAAYADAISAISQGQLDPSTASAQIVSGLGSIGVKASFVPEFVRAIEVRQVVLEQLKITTEAALQSAYKSSAVQVRVNPRYGSWDPTTVSLGLPNNPDYLFASPTAAAG